MTRSLTLFLRIPHSHTKQVLHRGMTSRTTSGCSKSCLTVSRAEQLDNYGTRGRGLKADLHAMATHRLGTSPGRVDWRVVETVCSVERHVIDDHDP